MTDFEGKNVLLTGGSSGIGKATAKLLAGAGANVWIVARDQNKIALALDEIRSVALRRDEQIVEGLSLDVTDYPRVVAAVDGLVQGNHIPDYLFNIAGAARPGYFQELPLHVFRETMERNFFGTLHTCMAVVPLMMARRRGHIVNTASGAALVGVFGFTAYCASKFAVRGFSDALRTELKPYGVRVSVLYPPDTDTPGLAQENVGKPPETFALSGSVKAMTPEQVAGELLKGVAKGRPAILPGFESKLMYVLVGLLGHKLDIYLDWVVRNTQKKYGGPRPVYLTAPANKFPGK